MRFFREADILRDVMMNLSFRRLASLFDRTGPLSPPDKKISISVTNGAPESFFDEDVRPLQARLRKLASDLDSVSALTEGEFLNITGSLQVFADGCAANSARVAEVVKIVDGEGGFDMAAFKTLIDTACEHTMRCADAIAAGIAEMSDLGRGIEAVSGLQHFLRNLSRSITIVGVLSRIETARLEAAEFGCMTSVIDDLAEQIGRSTGEITRSAKDGGAAISAAIAKMQIRLTKFRRELQSAGARVAVLLDGMQTMKRKAEEAYRRIEARGSLIVAETGEVVAALQYHDICRQRMEHVAAALTDVADEIAAVENAGPEDKAALGRRAADIVRIQIPQLESVMKETDASAAGISAHLTRIVELSEDQKEEAARITEQGESGNPLIEKIRCELEALAGITSDCKDMTTVMLGAVSEAGGRISLMSELASTIVEISENINLLAMNAILRVSRTGDSGRALGVLANRISRLSKQASGEIKSGAAKIGELLGRSERFREEFSGALKGQLGYADDICLRTRDAVKTLEDTADSMLKSMSGIAKATDSLKTEIGRLVAGMGFDRVVQNGVDSVLAELRLILDRLGKKIRDTAAIPADPPGLEGLERRYTMESEREIHEAVLAGAALMPVSVSFRGAGAAERIPENPDGGLGDNVDLF